MAEVYNIIKPHIAGTVTFEDLLRNMFHRDVNSLNKLYEALTGKSSEDVEGLTVVTTILSVLKNNDIGIFIALMKRKDG